RPLMITTCRSRPVVRTGPAVHVVDENVVPTRPSRSPEREDLGDACEHAEREQKPEDAAGEAVAGRAGRLDRVTAGNAQCALDEPGAGQAEAADQQQPD